MAIRRAAKLPPGVTPGLDVLAYLDGPARGTFSNACHGVEVRLDTWTGKVTLERYVVAADWGTMLNPTVVEGQVEGGSDQGRGSGLCGEVEYADERQELQ